MMASQKAHGGRWEALRTIHVGHRELQSKGEPLKDIPVVHLDLQEEVAQGKGLLEMELENQELVLEAQEPALELVDLELEVRLEGPELGAD